MGFFDKLKQGLGRTKNSIDEKINNVFSVFRKVDEELLEELEMPKTLKDCGIPEQEFLAKVDMLAERAFEDQCTTANPRLPLITEIKDIMIKAYYGE